MAMTAQRKITPKSMFWAAMLQGLPLLGAGGCAINAASGQQFWPVIFLWWSVLFWGFGYFYVGAFNRFAVVALLGPVFAFGACTASFRSVDYQPLFDHGNGEEARRARDDANTASGATAALVFVATAIVMADAVRLAEKHNYLVALADTDDENG